MSTEIDERCGLAPYGVPRARPGLRGTVACLAALALSACAGVAPPPRFSTLSPADANAPEGAVPPAAPLLTGEGELAEKHAFYACPTHRQVSANTPGHCPVCGASLVEQPARIEGREP
jgi:hypothetical protein